MQTEGAGQQPAGRRSAAGHQLSSAGQQDAAELHEAWRELTKRWTNHQLYVETMSLQQRKQVCVRVYGVCLLCQARMKNEAVESPGVGCTHACVTVHAKVTLLKEQFCIIPLCLKINHCQTLRGAFLTRCRLLFGLKTNRLCLFISLLTYPGGNLEQGCTRCCWTST